MFFMRHLIAYVKTVLLPCPSPNSEQPVCMCNPEGTSQKLCLSGRGGITSGKLNIGYFRKIKCRFHFGGIFFFLVLFPGTSMRWQSSMKPQWCDLAQSLVPFLMAPPTSHAPCHQVAINIMLCCSLSTGSGVVSTIPVSSGSYIW